MHSRYPPDPPPTKRLFLVKGEKTLSVIEVDVLRKEILKSDIMHVPECNTVFSECLMVQRVNNEDDLEVVEVLTTSNVEIEDNIYTREIRAITIPILYC